ncbi:hypothetical protein [Stenomitos frigidus]|uniref:Uncharacterized protein n=1 Tax=Stenomitos frigidus ULC18 TaxID=2107698 RepID=A0A2T1DZD6_9CYAN|nr:hypothetical protein [Stenomitos frigidus]PSB25867.1 hypothetical protein C7B82_21655 [Stenomitos frigidus ULC18]
MFDFSNLLEFSHNHCIAICAALVPANVLSTFYAIVLVWLQRPVSQVWQVSGLASVFALLMVLHVLTWFIIGVVMVPTFVLLSLGGVCLSINLWVILHPQSLRRFLDILGRRLGTLRTGTASLS